MDNNTSNNVTSGSTPNSDASGQTSNPQSGSTPSGTPQQKTPISSLPEDIQAYIKVLRKSDEDARKLLEAEQRAKEAAEQARLAEQGKFKELFQQEQARARQLEAERDQQRRENLLSRIATKHGLPPELASRLVGETEEDLNADALTLKKLAQVQVQVQQGNSPN